jgi:O-methyltransferase involved in polyketide biosynthesis
MTTIASRTALATSLMRALHTRRDPQPLIDDPYGERLVPESIRDSYQIPAACVASRPTPASSCARAIPKMPRGRRLWTACAST